MNTSSATNERGREFSRHAVTDGDRLTVTFYASGLPMLECGLDDAALTAVDAWTNGGLTFRELQEMTKGGVM